MKTQPWRIVLALVSGVVLALAIFSPFHFFPIVAFLPALLSIGWAIWVMVFLHGIREELRGLRRDLVSRDGSDRRYGHSHTAAQLGAGDDAARLASRRVSAPSPLDGLVSRIAPKGVELTCGF